MSEQLLVYRTLITAFVGRFVDLADDERGQTVDHIVWTGIALLGAAVVAAIIWNKLKSGANDIQVPAPAAP
jgi:Holliday junction resolvasome RuvABC ATP-dependent DNA helicase subunit